MTESSGRTDLPNRETELRERRRVEGVSMTFGEKFNLF